MGKKGTSSDIEWIKQILTEIKDAHKTFVERNEKQHSDILVQTKRTNGRVTKLEQWKIDHEKETENSSLSLKDWKGYVVAALFGLISAFLLR